MPARTVYNTSIEHISILDEEGNFDAELGKDLIPDEDVARLYEQMAVSRHFDEVAFKLQRSGRMGTYPENRGQEAVGLGATYVLREDDWLVTCYRENAGLFWRGLPMEYILLHWMGDERGNAVPQELRATPLAIPIGTHMLHAAGLAWSCKYRKEDRIACTFFGDGATSEGDFHEAMNFAANLELPLIFMCQNNGWAISVPTKMQCSAPTIAQRGVGYGMETVQCDGNDLFAVAKVVKDAAQRARTEHRPSFIEAITYRLGDHTTADDASRYRDEAELEQWKSRDPLNRLRNFLTERKLWDDARQEALELRAKEEVAAAVKRAENIAPLQFAEMFDELYAEPSDELQTQRETARTASLGQDPSQLEGATHPGNGERRSSPHPGRGRRSQRRCLSRHRGPLQALRARPRRGHAAGGVGDHRHGDRPGPGGAASRGRDPVRGISRPGLRPDLHARRTHPQPHPRHVRGAVDHPRAHGRGHPRARAAQRQPRGHLRPPAGDQGRHARVAL
jgi:pyruvate dehydrogenase E1 component alpha subunit